MLIYYKWILCNCFILSHPNFHKTSTWSQQIDAMLFVVFYVDDNNQGPLCPDFSKYLYFLFIPTLVYRDTYPRWRTFRFMIQRVYCKQMHFNRINVNQFWLAATFFLRFADVKIGFRWLNFMICFFHWKSNIYRIVERMVHGKSYQSDNKVQHQEIFLYTDKIWFILFILSFDWYINLQDWDIVQKTAFVYSCP